MTNELSTSVNFDDKLKWVLVQFNESHIPYAIGGALALGYYVLEPRATHDIDINVFARIDHADDVLDLLSEHVNITVEQKSKLLIDEQIRLFWEDTPLDIFFMNLDLHQRMRDKVQLREYAGIPIPILSVTHLVTCKAIFNRNKDWVDIDTVLAHPDLDKAEVTNSIVEICGKKSPQYRIWNQVTSSPVSMTYEDFQMLSLKKIAESSHTSRTTRSIQHLGNEKK